MLVKLIQTTLAVVTGIQDSQNYSVLGSLMKPKMQKGGNGHKGGKGGKGEKEMELDTGFCDFPKPMKEFDA